jgi:hypothetical protein
MIFKCNVSDLCDLFKISDYKLLIKLYILIIIARYKTRLIFLMLLKLNLLVIILFSILIVPYSINGSEKSLVYVDFIFVASVSLFNALAYKSVSKSNQCRLND